MRLHNLALARALVIDAAKVQHTVGYDAQQLSGVILTERLSIRSHRVKRDENVAGDHAATRVVKRDDVSVIVVLEKLPVDTDYLVVIAKDIGHRPHDFVMSGGYFFKPSLDDGEAQRRSIHSIGYPLK